MNSRSGGNYCSRVVLRFRGGLEVAGWIPRGAELQVESGQASEVIEGQVERTSSREFPGKSFQVQFSERKTVLKRDSAGGAQQGLHWNKTGW